MRTKTKGWEEMTTDSAEPVKTYHAKAVPVILPEPDELEAWVTAPWDEAMALQRPLPAGRLQIVQRGGKQDLAAVSTDA